MFEFGVNIVLINLSPLVMVRQLANFPIHSIDLENVTKFIESALAQERQINELINDKNSVEYLQKKVQINETEFFLDCVRQSTYDSLHEGN